MNLSSAPTGGRRRGKRGAWDGRCRRKIHWSPRERKASISYISVKSIQMFIPITIGKKVMEKKKKKVSSHSTGYGPEVRREREILAPIPQ